MATKADFTQDEWKPCCRGLLIAGVAISAADPSGIIGMMRESMASARALIQAKTDPNADALVKAVGTEFETSEGRLAQDGVKTAITGAKTPAEIVAKLPLDALKAASAVLGFSKAVRRQRRSRRGLPEMLSVAEATPEGGFLGFGGTQVKRRKRRRLLRSPARSAFRLRPSELQ